MIAAREGSSRMTTPRRSLVWGLGSVAAATIGAVLAAPSLSQAPPAGARPVMGSGLAGQLVFQRVCASCHADSAALAGEGEGRAPPLTTLQRFPSDRVYQSLKAGKMQAIGDTLTEKQRLDVASWLGGRPVGEDAHAGGVASMKHRCPANPPMAAIAGKAWNGWGVDTGNTRFQPAAAGGLTAKELPRLKVKWAFGIPNGVETYSQPTVVAGRVFFGSDNGHVYSLSASDGCAYWSFQADAPVRTAPVVAPVKGYPGVRDALYFGDIRANVYAIDAQSGRLLWKTPLLDKPLTRITGAPRVYDGRLYVGFSSGEQVTGAMPQHECCTSRGSVAALDANTGKLVWRTYMLPEPKELGLSPAGVKRFGPAGAAVWNTPTVDVRRKALYIGTGSGYATPDAETVTAVVALDIATGAIRWANQRVKGDTWLAGCLPGKPMGNCPDPLGPDYDYGSSPILTKLPDGREIIVAANKGGTPVALDPDRNGALIWSQDLTDGPPPPSGQIVFGGAVDATSVYYALQSGGVAALSLKDGAKRWFTDLPQPADRRGAGAAVTAIPGAILSGGWNGTLTALDTAGKPIWSFDTSGAFDTVNGVPAHGGSMGAPGATVANGMLFVGSGYVGVRNGMPGNVLLAFSVDGK
jgi:polyvinyl alcohol dehydrogenase (cytochrome)